MRLLLKELGFEDDACDRCGAAVTEKRLSQSFFASGRLDAEYYQPKYDYLDARLAAMPTKRLGEVVKIRKSIEPGNEAYQAEGVPSCGWRTLPSLGLTIRVYA